jgi:uncharacterized membrane protein
MRDDAAPSRAAIGGHPIHPMLIPFPIAFLVGAFAADLAFAATADPFWARGAVWLLAAGLVTGAAAAVFGLIDFLAIPRARAFAAAWVHLLGNGAALLVVLWNLVGRWADPVAGADGGAMTLSGLVVLILLVTGWMGGELAYRYRIGVMDRAEGLGRLERGVAAEPAYAADRPDPARRPPLVD